MCNTKRNFQALIELQSGHTYKDLLAYYRRHLVVIFRTTIRLKSDINVTNIYINIKAADRAKNDLFVFCNMIP